MRRGRKAKGPTTWSVRLAASAGTSSEGSREDLRTTRAAHLSQSLEDTAMLARIRKAQQENEGGFTLIELLVVMIIIGILAAIAIPVFLSQRAKAQDSAAKADVSTIGKEIATYFVDNAAAPTVSVLGTRYVLNAAGATPAITDADLGKVSTAVVIKPAAAATGVRTAIAWCIGVTNPGGDKKDWKYSAQNGLEAGVCATNILS